YIDRAKDDAVRATRNQGTKIVHCATVEKKSMLDGVTAEGGSADYLTEVVNAAGGAKGTAKGPEVGCQIDRCIWRRAERVDCGAAARIGPSNYLPESIDVVGSALRAPKRA